jgi:cysteine desulfurase
MNNIIYLDNAASTRVSESVLETMLPWMKTASNAHNRLHKYGSDAHNAIEAARKQIAKTINCDNLEIIFTSGATEANNLALKALINELIASGKNHVITSSVEHVSILEVLKNLNGIELTILPVKPCAMIEASSIKHAIKENTGLVTIQAVNNFTGTIQPLEEISEILNHTDILFHSDMAQAIGKINIDIQRLKLDLASMSSHKCNGPQGIGALYVRKEIQSLLEPLIEGGAQENSLRAGTLPTALCVGMGKAYEEINSDIEQIHELKNSFISRLKYIEPIIYGHSDCSWNVPHIIAIRFEGIDHETLTMALPDIAFSTGSACSYNSTNKSNHVMNAISDKNAGNETIRLSFDKYTTKTDVINAADIILNAIKSIKEGIS